MVTEKIQSNYSSQTTLSDFYLADEDTRVRELVSLIDLNQMARRSVDERALALVNAARSGSRRGQLIDQFLQQYGLSTQEGVTLMRLCEALIRTPDKHTADILLRDKISSGQWSEHTGDSSSLLVNASTRGLQISTAWIVATGGIRAKHLIAKLGDNVLRQAMQQAMEMMGDHFVLGGTIEAAVSKARKSEKNGYAYSYDMLGEAAHTQADAERYFNSYRHAIETLAESAHAYSSISDAPGISVKLSALHPRYEYTNSAQCIPELVERLVELCKIANVANIGLTIDAEEADRLEPSLEIFSRLLKRKEFSGWNGLGMVVQAYQRRALAVIDVLSSISKSTSRKITVRLVKGAYWDMEIKRAQELGLESYPVFTRKENTDVSYLACARKLFAEEDLIFPQFATHNAHTAAAIVEMAGPSRHFEFQRLHGMGESLHSELASTVGVRSRIYAPVGQHKDLLPYLVRRLLENGANSSFVNQLLDPSIEASAIVQDPIRTALNNKKAQHPLIPNPRDQFEGERLAAKGTDLTHPPSAASIETLGSSGTLIEASFLIDGRGAEGNRNHILSPTDQVIVGTAIYASKDDVRHAVRVASKSNWQSETTGEQRSNLLIKVANLLEEEQNLFLRVLMKEAGKTYADSIAEVREAVDFCRYYGNEAKSKKMDDRTQLGVVACISPWNFPLAIFLGQITAALAAGNTVIAKPAEQTPLVAYEAVNLLHRAGIPKDAIQLIIGDGATLGAALVANENIGGVCFTGSTRTAKIIAASLADTRRPATPLIAETGGINAMIVDSTALLEQAVTDVVDSAFRSAGQRCSACRIVCVQEDIADDFVTMLSGAMQLLKIGNPAFLNTDVGPVIDAASKTMLDKYIADKKTSWSVVCETSQPQFSPNGFFVAPIAFEVSNLSEIEDEIFGPVLHVVRFCGAKLDSVVDGINALGYGLTLGVHTRIDTRIDRIASRASVGNTYINRNQIGAVVGVQPFGGEGLSGTGPKAGGPHYVRRLSRSNLHSSSIGKRITQKDFTEFKNAGKQTDIETILTSLRLSQKNYGLLDRSKIFEFALSKVKRSDFLRRIEIKRCIQDVNAVFSKARILPGPTGEKNTLQLFGRGVLLCLGGNDQDLLERQLLNTLSSGNAAIIACEKSTREKINELVTILTQAGLPETLIHFIDNTEVENFLKASIEGCVCDGNVRDFVASHFCYRAGAILPVLSAHDDPERYCLERTLTINTTAAGGNASLLAM